MTTRDDVRKAFTDHHAYWAQSRGVMTVQAVGSEAAVTQQYAGRVPFELLQNALDRCQDRVQVIRTEHRLYVANDGKPVGVVPHLDHMNPPKDHTELSDFHALCSLHMSNKSPDENTGNKGVGFRSVFSLTGAARVWTRPLGEDWWWGVMLCDPMKQAVWKQALTDPEVRAGCQAFLQHTRYPTDETRDRPSHNFPMPMFSPSRPAGFPDELSGAATVVEIRLDRAKANQKVQNALDEMSTAHLDFIATRIPHKVTVSLHRPHRKMRSWEAHISEKGPDLASWYTRDPDLIRMARDANLKIGKRIQCAVRWPPPVAPTVCAPDYAPSLYCYLPSEEPGQFNADLHADFQLGMDRKTLDLKPAEEAGAYNGALMKRVADVHYCAVLRHLDVKPRVYGNWDPVDPSKVDHPGRAPAFREDIWRFLDPGPGLADVQPTKQPVRRAMVGHLWDHLFGNGDLKAPDTWRRWAALARACFNGRTPPSHTYREFWKATKNWINVKWTTSSVSDPRRAGIACLTALRNAEATVIPITGHDGRQGKDEPSVPGIQPPNPVRGGLQAGGKRQTSTLFQMVGDDEGDLADVQVPAAVRDRGREVTAWVFHRYFHASEKSPHLAGSTRFNRATLLRELGQLPGRRPADDLAERPRLAEAAECEALQAELVVFAARLYMLPVTSGENDRTFANQSWEPGWRGLRSKKGDAMAAAGRALGTVFLRCTDALWRPARQCHRHHLDEEFLRYIRKAIIPFRRQPDLLDAFLRFLGVCTWDDGLLLVEAGADGVVPAQAWPPDLVDPPIGNLPGVEVVMGVEGALGDEPCSDRPAAIDPSKTRKRVLEAWDIWLKRFTPVSGDDVGRSNVFQGLGKSAWYPVGQSRAQPPKGISNPPDAVAPFDLLLLARGTPRILQVMWRVSADQIEEGCLRALGATDLTGLLRDPGRTADVIRALALRYPDPAALQDESIALGLTELFNAAIVALAQATDKESKTWPADLPLLAHLRGGRGRTGLLMRALAWRQPDQIWAAQNSPSRNDLKRLFPQVPLLTAPLGSQQIKHTPMARRTLDLESHLKTDQKAAEESLALKAKFTQVLSRLVALAHLSRAYPGVVDADEIRGRWGKTRLVRARDVWLSWQVKKHPEMGSQEPLKGIFNDVIGNPHEAYNKVLGSEICFDVEGTHQHPPLAFFAGALAEALIDRSIEAEWRAALTEIDAEPGVPFPGPRLESYLARRGVDQALVDHYQQQLQPLSADQRKAHRSKVVSALATIELTLADTEWDLMRGTLLRPEDLAGVQPDCTEDQVHTVLSGIAWSEVEASFRVDFLCRNEHLHVWSDWMGTRRHRARALRLAFELRGTGERPRDAELSRGHLGRELDELGNVTASRVRFSPEKIVANWLGVEPVDDWLRGISDFKPVTTLRTVAVTPVSVPHGNATKVEYGAFDADGDRVKNARPAAKGLGAETAFLAFVVPTTAALIDKFGNEAWVALLSALHPNKRMWKSFEEAQRDGDPDLEVLLHISKRWNSAGFDVLGLEEVDGVCQPIRYEVKSIEDGDGSVRIFVSLNELNVLRGVRKGEEARFARGRWALAGVGGNGVASEITDSVLPLVDGRATELASLAKKGVLPEGMQVVVHLEPA